MQVNFKPGFKVCKDCKHYIPSSWISADPDRCRGTNRKTIDLISGKTEVSYYSCDTERSYLGDCRHEAKLFEPKEKQVSLWQRLKKMFKKA